MRSPGPERPPPPFDTLLVWIFGLAVRLAPLGLEARWRARLVDDFARRLSGRSDRGLLSRLALTAGALLDLTVESIRRRLRFSSGAQVRTRSILQRGMNPVDVVWQDVRYAIRGIRRSPGVATVVVVTLALAIGANSTLFSVVNGVLLSPLSYPDSEQLYQLVIHYEDGSRGDNSSFPDFADQRSELSIPRVMTAWQGYRATMTANGAEPERLAGLVVARAFFETLGLEPALGRSFTEADLTDRNGSVVMIGHGLWQRAFGGTPDVLGRTLELNGVRRTIVGVGPASHPRRLPGVGSADVFVPMEAEADPSEAPGRGSHNLGTAVRLPDGASLQSAEAELDALMARLRDAYPDSNRGKAADLESMHHGVVGTVASALETLMAAVGLVLLIAVANVTSVLLGRATDREREMALRCALGAGRGRAVSLLLAEAVTLAAVGGGLGVALAFWGTGRLVDWAGNTIPLAESVAVDLDVLVLSAGITLAAGVVMGLVPAWAVLRRDPGAGLREGSGGRGMGNRSRQRLRGALVVVQVALCLTLLTGSGLLIRSLARLSDVDAGVDGSVLTFGIHLPDARYPEWSDRDAFHLELEERLESLPGVEEVASINGTPMSRMNICGSLYSEEEPDRFAGGDTCAEVRSVSSDYFDVMGIPLINGRRFDASDGPDDPEVIIVGRATAELLWPGQDALGKRMGTGFRGTYHEVVGVVGDVKQNALDEPLTYQTYLPETQWRRAARNLVLRVDAPSERLMPAIREAVWSLDPQLPLYNVTTIGELRDGTLRDERFRTLLLAAMAALALVLAVVGIYGVISYSVSQRQREMAIRISLGALSRNVRRMVLGQALRLVVFGLALGAVGAYAFARGLQTLLFGVDLLDPITMLVVPTVLVAAAVAAVQVPARRATSVDPMTVLREE